MDTIDTSGLQALLDALRDRDYRVLGPVARDGAVVYDDVASVEDFPRGWRDVQEAGSYRLERTDGPAFFDLTSGPTSWKTFLHPPRLRLWSAEPTGDQGFRLQEEATEGPPPMAFLGVRACDLAAIRILDRVLMGDRWVDPDYAARRTGSFVVAVNCVRAGNTCFCASMGTGPEATEAFDLALTELAGDDRHVFTVEVGSERGAAVLAAIPHRPATAAEISARTVGLDAAREGMGRHLHAATVKDLLGGSRTSSHWDDVAERCLGCANCTMACPTCFCVSVEDVTDLATGTAERRKRWDSCFTLDYSYIHGGSVRPSLGARYRQWITHKLCDWEEQFGTLGCVGCGRCIAWCPVGIDITAEVAALESTRAPRTVGGAS